MRFLLFSELSIQPSLNAILIPRGAQEASNSPQDGAGASSTADATDATSAPVHQAAASGIA